MVYNPESAKETLLLLHEKFSNSFVSRPVFKSDISMIAYKWANETYGLAGETWLTYGGFYYFLNEKDRTLFELKWR